MKNKTKILLSTLAASATVALPVVTTVSCAYKGTVDLLDDSKTWKVGSVSNTDEKYANKTIDKIEEQYIKDVEENNQILKSDFFEYFYDLANREVTNSETGHAYVKAVSTFNITNYDEASKTYDGKLYIDFDVDYGQKTRDEHYLGEIKVEMDFKGFEINLTTNETDGKILFDLKASPENDFSIVVKDFVNTVDLWNYDDTEIKQSMEIRFAEENLVIKNDQLNYTLQLYANEEITEVSKSFSTDNNYSLINFFDISGAVYSPYPHYSSYLENVVPTTE